MLGNGILVQSFPNNINGQSPGYQAGPMSYEEYFPHMKILQQYE